MGIRCAVHALPHTSSDQSSKWHLVTYIFPEDVNRRQVFDILSDPEIPDKNGPEPVEQIKLVFEESSDFFGRITVYDLDIEGYIHTDS